MKHLRRINEMVNMPSIFKKQVVYSVDCSDLASLIKKLYGHDPQIEASLELGDDDTFEIEAIASEFEDKSQREFDAWKIKPRWRRHEIYMLMNKLAFDGHIEDGDYLIKTY